jgi:hypothetical protein
MVLGALLGGAMRLLGGKVIGGLLSKAVDYVKNSRAG